MPKKRAARGRYATAVVSDDEPWAEAPHPDFAVINSALLDRQGGVRNAQRTSTFDDLRLIGFVAVASPTAKHDLAALDLANRRDQQSAVIRRHPSAENDRVKMLAANAGHRAQRRDRHAPSARHCDDLVSCKNRRTSSGRSSGAGAKGPVGMGIVLPLSTKWPR
jgi:hypothetical protein